MEIAVVGGGPGGMYFAAVAKQPEFCYQVTCGKTIFPVTHRSASVKKSSF
jgi:hypothetical protein